MKKLIFRNSTLAFVFMALIFNASVTNSIAKVMVGQELYRSRCASCHGPDGKGSLKMAKTLKADPIRMDLTRDRVVQRSDEDLQRFIASGHGRMPKQPSLTSVQIQSLIRYLRTLQKAYASK
jgi:mono/diheme cytochrome c family protein